MLPANGVLTHFASRVQREARIAIVEYSDRFAVTDSDQETVILILTRLPSGRARISAPRSVLRWPPCVCLGAACPAIVRSRGWRRGVVWRHYPRLAGMAGHARHGAPNGGVTILYRLPHFKRAGESNRTKPLLRSLENPPAAGHRLQPGAQGSGRGSSAVNDDADLIDLRSADPAVRALIQPDMIALAF